MPRLELIFLHSASADGYSVRAVVGDSIEILASTFVFIASIRYLTDLLQQRIVSGMSLYFEELDYRPTPIGALSLRRRKELSLGVDVFEIKLGDEYLMSSLFTVSEIALARLGLGELSGGDLDVVVGGLGLGYTAQAVLEHEAVRSLVIVEALDAVIDWHEKGVLPLGPALTADPRSRFVLGDFFALAASKNGFDPIAPARQFNAILIDIDHSPDFFLDPQNAAFYQPTGLQRLAAHLLPGGVFGLWSNQVPDEAFTQRLTKVFAEARAERVAFHNPLQNREFTQTVYLARTESAPVGSSACRRRHPASI